METIRFFLPGPSYVPEDARAALTAPALGHRSAPFQALYRGLSERLPPIFRTRGEVMIATGSSTLIMESAVVSCAAESVLNLTNGSFSERWHTISRQAGKAADRISVPWGEAIDPDLVRRALSRKRYDAVTVVHNETSTGVISPLAEIARAVREGSDALLLVDAVSSVAGAPVESDAWGLDVALAGVQKGFAAPSGLTAFTLSERAAERAEQVGRRGFYTDLLRYRDQHRQAGPITTPATSLHYALDVQVRRILDEGIEARWERHRRLAAKTAAWAATAGCSYASAPGAHSPTVACLKPPAGIEPKALVSGLAARGFTISSGYGDWKPSTFRIGHMGEVRESDLDLLFAAADEVLAELRTPAFAGQP